MKSTLASYFEKIYGKPAEVFAQAPGRIEFIGNHTDYNGGFTMGVAIDKIVMAALAKRDDDKLCFASIRTGEKVYVDINDIKKQNKEHNWVNYPLGVFKYLLEAGMTANSGFDMLDMSSVPPGAGLSSSAAFEVLVGAMLSGLFWPGRCSPVEIAQIGQHAENVYFGKPCGLMDQTASSVGGVVAIDFADPARPQVEQIPLDFAATGHALCILDSGAGHADLTAEYAAITDELRAVCRCFGREVLREVPEEAFLAELPRVRGAAGDRAALRAFHFYAENRRAGEQAQALKNGDFDAFLALVRDSGRSSALYLQNVVPTGQTAHQELLLTIALCERILNGRGAVRVHGGGFGGTAQAFVPVDLLAEFQARTEAVLGAGSCHVLSIRPAGGVRLA